MRIFKVSFAKDFSFFFCLNAADGFSVDMPRNSEQLSGTTATKFQFFVWSILYF